MLAKSDAVDVLEDLEWPAVDRLHGIGQSVTKLVDRAAVVMVVKPRVAEEGVRLGFMRWSRIQVVTTRTAPNVEL